ncbi:MAG: hypothetical protein GVY05_07795 [Bacteroidetes bacterium]|jgi:predicted unusual protein kinase regulating ubiquinone biosynthesis (AarF/ABC1/UbiB family)|nr:hypothetical protein [Bacteroidota bacterium]
METLHIDILNPKAKKLLNNLADLKLIKINKNSKTSDFNELLENIRSQSTEDISFEEITKEVEQVRKKRYEA